MPEKESEDDMKRDRINIRDPFILPSPEDGLYFMYGTTAMNKAPCFELFVSRDLEEFDGPFPLFSPPDGFWADERFWAPEVHRWRGAYCMFATMGASAAGLLGTQVLRTDTPRGPFVPVSDHPLTPRSWRSLDGTLFADETGAWMIFCHEWVQIGDGSVELMPLAPDLSAPAGEPRTLFHASEAPWVRPVRRGCFVTDGPFVFRHADGGLRMLWSSFGEGGYAVGMAYSEGGIAGPWRHFPEPLYHADGGHAMIFRKFDGSRCLAFHSPNRAPLERACFLPLSPSFFP